LTGPRVAEDETLESLGPYFFVQRKAGHRLTSDTVALAEFVLPSLSEEDSAIDIGSGTGAIPLILAWKSKVRKIVGVEIDPCAAAVAEKNIQANGLEGRVEIVQSDYRELKKLYPEGSFSVVVSNPPYFRAGVGRISPNKEKAAARTELSGGIADLIDISAYFMGGHGRVFYVYPKARLAEMLEGLGKAGLRANRLRFLPVGSKEGLFLIEAGRDGGLTVEYP